MGAGIVFHIRNMPFTGGVAVLVTTGGDMGYQDFIYPISDGAAVNMAGALGDNSRGDRGGDSCVRVL
ncbi:MAG: hypothetical protein GPOALKHO_000078 [Sodalis sp.]|nr:MAG: hypothetical protein GPOALKHO_000078 [Sodalis sp.]